MIYKVWSKLQSSYSQTTLVKNLSKSNATAEVLWHVKGMEMDITNQSGVTRRFVATSQELEKYAGENALRSPTYHSVYEDVSLDVFYEQHRGAINAFIRVEKE